MDLKLPKDFKELLKLLNANGVEYLLVGGYAVGFHGYPRATNDMDIFISNDLNNAEKIVEALKDFGFDTNQLSTDAFTKDKSLVKIGVEPIKIEIINFISGVTFKEAFEKRVIGRFDDLEVKIISLENLKKNKLASGRHKDLDDIENLP